MSYISEISCSLKTTVLSANEKTAGTPKLHQNRTYKTLLIESPDPINPPEIIAKMDIVGKVKILYFVCTN